MRTTTHLQILAALALAAPALVAPALADDAAAKGLEIAQEVKRRDTGYQDFSTTARMTLSNAQGQSSVKELEVKTLEVPGQGEKSLILFTAPADTKDTVLLSYSYKTKADDQWLYLPAMKRTKRIASGNKSGSFVGSEFSYEDISPQQVEKYTYKYLKEETESGQACHVVERYPVDKKSSGYTRQVLWIDKAEYRPLKAENYDRKDSLLKTLTFTNYKKYAGKFWRPLAMGMTNHQTGKKTTISYSEFKFGTGLTEAQFDSDRLDRGQ
ncbi:MAG: outer membrane lipoprotein-sorting protein [Verrucomicrobiales bacterium]